MFEPLLEAVRRACDGERTLADVRAIARFHRIQASPGYDAAADWMEEAIRRAGLTPERVRVAADGRTRHLGFPMPEGWRAVQRRASVAAAPALGHRESQVARTAVGRDAHALGHESRAPDGVLHPVGGLVVAGARLDAMEARDRANVGERALAVAGAAHRLEQGFEHLHVAHSGITCAWRRSRARRASRRCRRRPPRAARSGAAPAPGRPGRCGT